jgi:cytidine deaminase
VSRAAADKLAPGALVENVSLGLAMCAERAALFATVARGLSPVTLALVSKQTSGQLTFPCGACLQVALELAGPDLRVVAADPDGTTASSSVGDLLPRAPHRSTYAPVA